VRTDKRAKRITQSYSVAEVGLCAWMMSFCVKGEKLDSRCMVDKQPV